MPHVQAHTSVHGATLSRGGMLLPLLRSGRSSSSSSSSSSHACEDIWPQTVHHRQLRSPPGCDAPCDAILKSLGDYAADTLRRDLIRQFPRACKVPPVTTGHGWTLVLGRAKCERALSI